MCPFLIHSQEYLENNPNWSKYSKVIEINPSFKDYKNEYSIKNGMVVNKSTFLEDSLVSSISYVYDKHNNVEMEINNVRKDTLNHKNQYHFDDILESDNWFYYFYNEKGELIEKRDKQSFLFSTYYIYDNKNLIEYTTNSYVTSNGEWFKTINLYKYDKCENVVESKSINLKFKTKTDKSSFDNAIAVKYYYKYKKRDCIWIKKYAIENGKKKLITKRILKK